MRTLLVGLIIAGTGCTLHESRGDGPGSQSPDAGVTTGTGPVGAQFILGRAIIGGETCDFAQAANHINISIESTTALLVNFELANDITVIDRPANEQTGDAPNVLFTHDEIWQGSLGTVFPSIRFQVWLAGPLVTGKAMTSFSFVSHGTTRFCSYTWALDDV
jgi:hypothetical protein